MSAPFLQIRDLTVARGGKTVLEVDSFEAAAGSITVLLGENGAGKSTLLLAAAGLLDLERGRIDLFGQPFHTGRSPAPRDLRRRLAMVQQEPYLFRGSVADNLAWGLTIRGLPRPQRAARVSSVLDRLGIHDLVGRQADELSGGERKLVALGRALAVDPEALILDEVTASLDEKARERVASLLSELAARDGRSILLATHIEGLADRLGARSVQIQAGRLLGDA